MADGGYLTGSIAPVWFPPRHVVCGYPTVTGGIFHGTHSQAPCRNQGCSPEWELSFGGGRLSIMVGTTIEDGVALSIVHPQDTEGLGLQSHITGL